MFRQILLAFVVTGSSATLSRVAADDPSWSRFHGADGLGIAADGHLPDRWDTSDYRWSVALGGTDVGSPIIEGNVVYLTDTSPASKTVDLLAIDLESGEELWRYQQPLAGRSLHARNSPAATTPTTDGTHVYMAHGDAAGASILAVDRAGRLVWQRDLGSWQGQHGFGASPIVVGDRVILLNEQQADQLDPGLVPGESRMMAFDRHTGESVWTTPLQTTRVCYGVPAVFVPSDAAMPTQIIASNTGNGLFGLDHQTGEMLWSIDLFKQRCCSSPIVVGGMAMASCGSGGGGNVLCAVQIPSSPNESPKEVFRINRAAPYVPTSVVAGELLLTISDNGIASAIDWKGSGRVVWSERLGGNYGASPIVVGDKLLLISLAGQATLLRAARTKQWISQFDLGGSVGATPAYAKGCLVIRVGDQLHCLGPSEQ